MELVEAGVVTGTRKTLRRGKVVPALALGLSRRFYDFLHENSAVDFAPVDWVNDPRVIARMPNFVSLSTPRPRSTSTGSARPRPWGAGTTPPAAVRRNFARGAMYSEGGQGFIVLASTTRDGSVSKIRPTLSPGSVVTTKKNTVDKIVTEYGVAEMRGRTMGSGPRP